MPGFGQCSAGGRSAGLRLLQLLLHPTPIYLLWQTGGVLRHLKASFYDGSACHLDLVQWATKPRWIELDPSERENLLQADVPFLKSQLSHEHLRLVVVNGSGVREQYERFFGVRLQEVQFPRQTCLEVSGGPSISFFQCRTPSDQHVVGWNINLQSTFGVSTENVRAIAERVARIASCPKPQPS